MAQTILLTGQEWRRRWSPADRLEILEAAFAQGANVSDVARRFDVSTGLLYTWRRQALSVAVTDGPAFVPATVVGAAGGGDGVAATSVTSKARRSASLPTHTSIFGVGHSPTIVSERVAEGLRRSQFGSRQRI